MFNKLTSRCTEYILYTICRQYSPNWPFNPFDSKGNYSATSSNTKLVDWPLMGCLLHLVQRGGAWAGCGPGPQQLAPPSLLVVPNVTAHPSTASVPIAVLLYDGPLRCGFNVTIKGLSPHRLKCKRGLDAMAISICLSVRLSVCRLKRVHKKRSFLKNSEI